MPTPPQRCPCATCAVTTVATDPWTQTGLDLIRAWHGAVHATYSGIRDAALAIQAALEQTGPDDYTLTR